MRRVEKIGALVAVLLAAATPLRAQPPMGRMRVELLIASPRIADALTPTTRADVARQVATAMATMASEKFPYLTWTADAAAPAGTPVLRLKVIQGSSQPPCREPIRYLFEAETSRGAWQSPLPLDLYQGCDPSPGFKRPAELVGDLETKFQAFLAADDDVEHLESEVLAYVPLTDRVTAETDATRLLVPLALTSLQARKDSVLKVDFEVDRERGQMEMHPWQAVGQSTQVMLRYVHAGNVMIETSLTDGLPWDARIPDLLQRSVGLAVFMQKYVHERPLCGGLACDFGGGGQ